MLDDKRVKALPAPANGSYIEKDFKPGDDSAKAMVGFGCRITAKGVKAFVLKYRARGIERCMTLGSFPTWNVARARAEARKLRFRIDRGEDPLEDRLAELRAPTVRQLAAQYADEHIPKKRPNSGRDDMAMLKQWILPALGSKKVADVRPADIERLHTTITKAGRPTRANRVVAVLSKMFALAVKWEYRTDNPVRGAIDRNPETRRKRYLSPAEIARLSAALAALPSRPAADAIRLLMLTGARKTEVLAARWPQFDLEVGTWTKPASATKQGTDHHVPLSAPALLLLNEMKNKSKGEYLFPDRGGVGYLDIRDGWEAARKAAGLTDVRLHDLRHSFASILVSSGASLELIGALLGHSNPNTTARYAHLFLDPQRAAANRVGEAIEGAASGGTAQVVSLSGARR